MQHCDSRPLAIAESSSRGISKVKLLSDSSVLLNDVELNPSSSTMTSARWSKAVAQWLCDPLPGLPVLLELRKELSKVRKPCACIVNTVCVCSGLPCLASTNLSLLIRMHSDEVAAAALRAVFDYAVRHEATAFKAYCKQNPELMCSYLDMALFDDNKRAVTRVLLSQRTWTQAISLQQQYTFFRKVNNTYTPCTRSASACCAIRVYLLTTVLRCAVHRHFC
jgi:hypothetical protein